MNDFESRARHAADAVKSEVDRTAGDQQRGLSRAQRPRTRVAVPVVAALLLVAGLAVALPRGGDESKQVATDDTNLQLASSLTPFGRCDDLLQYFKDNAEKEINNPVMPMPWAEMPAQESTAKDAANDRTMAAPAAAGAAPAFSTTNVQEAGVDEPDVVKTDGKRIVAVAMGRTHLLDDNNGRPQLRATLPEQNAINVFFAGNRLLVFSSAEGAGLSLYDVSDFAKPELVASMTIDGQVVDARQVGDEVRVITNSTPMIGFGGDQQLRERIAGSTAEQWIPEYTLRDGKGAEIDSGPLVECENLSRPKTFSGISTVALTTFDIGNSLKDTRSVGVVASGQKVYATDKATYVSSMDYAQFGNPQTTYLHKFVTDTRGETKYTGSGEVKGNLLNQYAMSEYDGVLRVASTVVSNDSFFQRRATSEGIVTTLRENNGSLEQVGVVGGLGKADNESITAVRFIGDKGYVVTFRQTDPLYVLDLRDPKTPKVTGELKIPGFSGYLHPVGENLVLGVGQDVGVQFSLFDVSDPANPKRIGQQAYGSGAAQAQFDPKAFLYWQPRNVVVAPTSIYTGNQFSGLMLLRPTNNGLDEVGRLAFTGPNGSITRTFVIGDRVYMLSYDGLQVNSLDTHREIDKVALQSGIVSPDGPELAR